MTKYQYLRTLGLTANQLERKLVLVVVALFLFIVLMYTGAVQPGNLAKVDFISDFGIHGSVSSWDDANFGSPSGVSVSVRIYKSIVSFLPTFIYRDFLFYFALPIVFLVLSSYWWSEYVARSMVGQQSSLMASYFVAFLITSPILVSVFAYGWNLMTCLSIAGMTIAWHGLDRFRDNDKITGLMLLAAGSFLVGGLIHFLVAITLYALFSASSLRSWLVLFAIIVLADAYVLLPEIYKILFSSFSHYQGVDPVENTKIAQLSLGAVNRFSGQIDPSYQQFWSFVPGFLITGSAIMVFFDTGRLKKIPRSFWVVLLFFGSMHFSGIVWDLSVNRLLTYIPLAGGMFRNPDKNFHIFLMGLCFLAILPLVDRRMTRAIVLLIILINASTFYFASDFRNALKIAQVKPPSAYGDFFANAGLRDYQDRLLLLPFPDWFHYYNWADRVQVTNVFRRMNLAAVVSDEMTPQQNVSSEMVVQINTLLDGECNAANLLGFTHIVVQKDLLQSGSGKRIRTENMEASLNRCFGTPVFSSQELVVYGIKGALGRVVLLGRNRSIPQEYRIKKLQFGLGVEICSDEQGLKELILKDRPLSNSFVLVNDNWDFDSGSKGADGWLHWTYESSGCRRLINLHSVVSMFGLIISGGILILFFGITLYKLIIIRRLNQRERIDDKFGEKAL